MKTIDLNCDVGEGLDNEEQLMPFISSCNIACGKHAGDEETIRRVVKLAMQYKVAIGAHPSFDDRANFGRTEITLPPVKITSLVADQVEILTKICFEQETQSSHVKPHGALYNQAARSWEISSAIIDGILSVNKELKLFGLAGSEMEKAARGRIRFVAEGFSDRKYATRTELIPRSKNGLMMDLDEIKEHLHQLLVQGKVSTRSGEENLEIQTLCLHGDTPSATEMIKTIRKFIVDIGLKIQAP